MLRDVHAAEHFQPRSDRRRERGGNVAMSWNVPSTRKRTRICRASLEMYVARARGTGARENAIDRPHRRLFCRLVELVFGNVVCAPAARAATVGPPRVAALANRRIDEHGTVGLRERAVERVGLRIKAMERTGNLVLERDVRLDLAA